MQRLPEDHRPEPKNKKAKSITLGLILALVAGISLSLSAKGCISLSAQPKYNPRAIEAPEPSTLVDRQGRLVAHYDPRSGDSLSLAPAYTSQSLKQIGERLGSGFMSQTGLKIRLPLDLDLQRAAQIIIGRELQNTQDPSKRQPKRHNLSATLVAMEADTRRVVAMASVSQIPATQNRTSQDRRPAGTSLKPFLAAAALRSGTWDPKKLSSAPSAPSLTQEGKPTPFAQEAFQPITLKLALRGSHSTPMVRAARDLDPQTLNQTFAGFGLPVPSSPLQAATGKLKVSPLEMTSAFATLAAGGLAGEAIFSSTILAPEGELEAVKFHPQRLVLLPEESRILEAILRRTMPKNSLVASWPSVVAKQGRANSGNDGWFVGYSGRLVVGVWVGSSHPDPDSSGPDLVRCAERIWADFMSRAMTIS